MDTVFGKKIQKTSKKPFKSGLMVGTVEAICTSLYDPKKRLAYVLQEDSSIVNVEMCQVFLTSKESE